MSTPSEIFVEGKKHISAQIAFTGWSVSKGVLYDEFNAKEIKGVKIGRAYYVDEEAFEQYCTERGLRRKPVKRAEVKEESNLECRVIRLESSLQDLMKFLQSQREEAVQANLLSEEAA